MITEEMMRTTEMILMSYFFDMSEWLKGDKVINSDIVQKDKDDLLHLLKTDFEEIADENGNNYLDDLSVTIATLEELSEDDYQKIKTTIFSWEPMPENQN